MPPMPQPKRRTRRHKPAKRGRPVLASHHICGAHCKHFCYEFGGANADGSWCRKLQGEGIDGYTAGTWGSMCAEHVEQLPAHMHKLAAELTPLERKFVAMYCGPARGNAALAARMVGVADASDVVGSNLRNRDKVRMAIDAWLNAFGVTNAMLTSMIADAAGASMVPFTRVLDDGKVELFVTPENWEKYGHWVKAITVSPNGDVTLTLVDAAAARRDLAKIRRLYSDAPQVNLFAFLSQASDEEVLQKLEEARAAIVGTGPKLLTAGEG